MAPRLHDKVNICFFQLQSVLWPHVNAIRPDGCGISDLLRQELKALKLCPLDDAVNEGPHAQAACIAHHGRSATWPWVASTQRLAQNLANSRKLSRKLYYLQCLLCIEELLSAGAPLFDFLQTQNCYKLMLLETKRAAELGPKSKDKMLKVALAEVSGEHNAG